MLNWWQKLLSMPDAERAEMLAKVSVWTIIALLYILGGISLYLRAKYLMPNPSPTPAQIITITPTKKPTPTKTLYPSRTPKPAGASVKGNRATGRFILIQKSAPTVKVTI